jgi:hypothetical protein
MALCRRLPVTVMLFCTTCGLHHTRRDIEGAQIGHMIGGVIGFIFANGYAAPGTFRGGAGEV